MDVPFRHDSTDTDPRPRRRRAHIMFVLSPTTVVNPNALEIRSAPRRFLGRIAILPARGASPGLILRLLFESQPLRFVGSLTPFIAAMFVWKDLALPIAQAPLAMIILITIVEMRILRLNDTQRAALCSPENATETLDRLRFSAQAVLSRIAARQEIAEGVLHLVVEQSELARIAPLTLVSVQRSDPEPELLALDAEECRLIREELFEHDGERKLQRTNLSQDEFLRSFDLDPRGVTAHTRLAARLARPGPQDGEVPT